MSGSTKKPILAKKPEEWGSMTPEEKKAFAAALAEQMGVPKGK